VRFRLRTLLIFFAISSVLLCVLATVIVPWYCELRVSVSISKFGADVITEPRGQYLFRQFAGDALSERAVYVHLNDPRITDGWLAQLPQLKHIEVLSIKSPNVSDQSLAHLCRLTNLRTLNLVDTQITAAGVEALRRSLPRLKLVQRRNSN
jgi:hypothetical protein